jgi:hypothetical protein
VQVYFLLLWFGIILCSIERFGYEWNNCNLQIKLILIFH